MPARDQASPPDKDKPDQDNSGSPIKADWRERTRIQLKVIRDALGRDNVGVATPTDDEADFEYLYGPGQVLVRDRDLERVGDQLAATFGSRGSVESGLVDGLTLYNLPGTADVPGALALLDRQVGIGVVTPDHILYVTTSSCCPATEPDVPPNNTPVPPQSKNTDDGAGVFVSVVDTGWWDPAADPSGPSPWLAGVTGDPEQQVNLNAIRPYAGHGTFIAGVIRCVAPKTEIRVEGYLPLGGAIRESKMITQLTQAVRLGPDIISFSGGARSRGNRALMGFEVFWENHLQYLKGTVFVAAAGNDSTREPFWPAAFPWALSVGAADAGPTRAHFSNFGSWVDVYAPGVDLVNAYLDGTYVCVEPPNAGNPRSLAGMTKWSGTSFATPVVSGMIAARMSQTGLSARDAADQLLAEAKTNAVPGLGPYLEP